LGIKNLKPQANSKYHQGYFDKYNPQKYVGPRPIIFRSDLELRFMRNMELNPEVEKWSSENIVIPYIMKEKQKDGKFREVKKNYNIDFTVYLKNKKQYIIEVKPSALVPLNESQIMRNPMMMKNASKWKAAIQWCKLNNFEFKIVTEKNLTGNNF
jgi:hypothetical protein